MRRLALAGIVVRPQAVVRTDYTTNTGYAAFRQLMTLRPRPTALFCGNDWLAVGALNGARELGLDVPADLTVVGFDDLPVAAWPVFDLTTVSNPVKESAAEAARLLVRRIASGSGPATSIDGRRRPWCSAARTGRRRTLNEADRPAVLIGGDYVCKHALHVPVEPHRRHRVPTWPSASSAGTRVISCNTAFIDCRTPGSDLKENYALIGSGVSQNPDQFINLQIRTATTSVAQRCRTA